MKPLQCSLCDADDVFLWHIEGDYFCEACIWEEFIFQDDYRIETEAKYADPLYRPPQEERE